MQQPSSTYDLIGIGIGPFNLGLAALASNIPNLSTLFLDQHPTFNWHPGLLLPNARMQVPYYADLVTLANPQSPFSYFAFLHAKQRMFRFAIQDNPNPLRREYNEYCQWVAAQLPSLHFGYTCTHIYYNEATQFYEVHTQAPNNTFTTFHGKHLVIGTGTTPHLPNCIKDLDHPDILHSGEYLFRKEYLLDKHHITLIGSGQSAAEIFQDLLNEGSNLQQLSWFTRSARFFPMEQSPFAWEMSSPDYIDYFYDLSPDTKRQLIAEQDALYKGINGSLIREISNQLYANSLYGKGPAAVMSPSSTLRDVVPVPYGPLLLEMEQVEQKKYFQHTTDALILATGYAYQTPDFLRSIKERIQWTPEGHYQVNRNYSIDLTNTIFVQNADLHTHGFNSADLGMGPYRNAMILNAILGYEHFQMEKDVAFQTFGVPTQPWALSPGLILSKNF